jgi:hypothetical protein
VVRNINEAEILRWLEKAGATVRISPLLGYGGPTMLVGYANKNFLIRVASKHDHKAKDFQVQWDHKWSGKVFTVRNAEEALLVIGAVGS